MTLADKRTVLCGGSRKLKPITEQKNNGGAAMKRLENVVGASNASLGLQFLFCRQGPVCRAKSARYKS